MGSGRKRSDPCRPSSKYPRPCRYSTHSCAVPRANLPPAAVPGLPRPGAETSTSVIQDIHRKGTCSTGGEARGALCQR
eukprot:12543837-Alexandrium_andersonii.AAC.1